MIHISVDVKDLPPGWLAKADALTEQLLECEDDGEDVPLEERRTAAFKRQQIIGDNDYIWTQLKPVLLKWSHKKCWYSELRDDGSDYHVDHFRPKGRVRDEGVPDRDGYWWLAFNWMNYRAAVAWVNSLHGSEEGPARGKADHFPLAPGSPIARKPTDDIEMESPAFLDPRNEDDVLLLDFDETGLPVPAAEGWNAERVMITRRLLHLDAVRMNEARQKAWRDCEEKLLMIAMAMNAPGSDYRRRDSEMQHLLMKSICKMLKPNYPLSAVYRACVLKCRYPWARRLPNHPLSQLSEDELLYQGDGSGSIEDGEDTFSEVVS
jgi:hypothetical protein